MAAMLAYHNVAYPFDADASGIVDSNGSGSLEYDDGEQILRHLLDGGVR